MFDKAIYIYNSAPLLLDFITIKKENNSHTWSIYTLELKFIKYYAYVNVVSAFCHK